MQEEIEAAEEEYGTLAHSTNLSALPEKGLTAKEEHSLFGSEVGSGSESENSQTIGNNDMAVAPDQTIDSKPEHRLTNEEERPPIESEACISEQETAQTAEINETSVAPRIKVRHTRQEMRDFNQKRIEEGVNDLARLPPRAPGYKSNVNIPGAPKGPKADREPAIAAVIPRHAVANINSNDMSNEGVSTVEAISTIAVSKANADSERENTQTIASSEEVFESDASTELKPIVNHVSWPEQFPADPECLPTGLEDAQTVADHDTLFEDETAPQSTPKVQLPPPPSYSDQVRGLTFLQVEKLDIRPVPPAEIEMAVTTVQYFKTTIFKKPGPKKEHMRGAQVRQHKREFAATGKAHAAPRPYEWRLPAMNALEYQNGKRAGMSYGVDGDVWIDADQNGNPFANSQTADVADVVAVSAQQMLPVPSADSVQDLMPSTIEVGESSHSNTVEDEPTEQVAATDWATMMEEDEEEEQKQEKSKNPFRTLASSKWANES